MKYVLLSEKKWHQPLLIQLQKKYKNEAEWLLIDRKEAFTYSEIARINPNKIFIPHWSYIIHKDIFSNYECIVFHMTDLPFGRGGSPLQNLILRGVKETKVSAIKVTEGIDTGDIYLKERLPLFGTAREIFERATPVIQGMIGKIIDEKIIPQPQKGKAVLFKRRKPEESNISNLSELEKVYDYIRMLDCDGYPQAYIETEHLRIDFSEASLSDDYTRINANVRIYKK